MLYQLSYTPVPIGQVRHRALEIKSILADPLAPREACMLWHDHARLPRSA